MKKIIGKPFKKGMTPWYKGIVGWIPWNKGKTGYKMPKKMEEVKEKIKKSNLKTYEKIKYKWQKENHPNWGKHLNVGCSHPNWKGGITPKEKSERTRFRRSLQKLI